MNLANGYEQNALKFLEVRDKSLIGRDVVQRWAQSLGPRTRVIDIGCGGGLPATRALAEAGLRIWAIDASPTLVRKFKTRFPHVPAKCEQAEVSDCFGLHYDAAIAVGLLFLLRPSLQIAVIKNVSGILRPGGRFLFTAPIEAGSWKDAITGLESRSLGRAHYESVLESSGFRIDATCQDEGANNYFDVEKLPPAKVTTSRLIGAT